MPVPKKNEKKVERAFEVIERLEKNDKDANNAAATPKKVPRGRMETEKSGLRIHFALDAMVSENDTRKTGEKDLQAGKSKVLDIRFTVPYIWQIPVIGKTAMKIVKFLQPDRHSESVRDILKSLQRDKKR
ncbi:MAG: hypothetical protein R6T92_05815 [Desulfosalsimonadaceae bacterium]